MRKLIFMVVALAMTNLAISQTASPELVSSSGDSFNNTSYQLDWSIGELATETYVGSQNMLTQGFHQGKYKLTTVEDLRADIKISIYPNPTSDVLNLSGFENLSGLSYTISNFSGKVLQTANLAKDIEQINFSNYAAGVYFISVSENNQLIKSFKIIKN